MATSTIYFAAAACALAGIDNKRFNEAVAKGFLPCAPAARRGSERKFTENDVIALFVYARLVDQSMPQRLAGQVACQVKSKIEEDPEAREVRVQKLREEEKKPVGPEHLGLNEETSVYINHLFDVAGIRKFIRASTDARRSDSASDQCED